MSTLALITILLLSHGLVCAQDVRDEEVDDYFNKWLREDTVYIISPEERSVFEKLSSPEEKERFIEQFWFRRDPDPGNAFNEFKEEHYRRIAYANEHYKAGKAGWTTDRGRIYIIHGPPANIMMRPMGGLHKRTLQEGGGATTTFPHEVWSYRYIEGIGNDVEFEFVDSNLSGNYRLALTPDEKDALLHTGLGATLEESLGMKTRADRIREQTMLRPLEDRTLGAQKSPIERLQNYFQAFRNPEITYHDLQNIVETRVTYEELPLGTRADYFWVAGERFMATVTLQLANRELTYKQDGARNGARVDVYGAVQDLSGKTAYEFEQTLFVNTPSEIAMEKGHTLYQHAIPLEPGRYKLDWVVRDLHSGKLGTSAHALVLPRRGKDEFFTSSLILADRIRGGSGDPLEPFNTLSGLKVYPNVEKNTFALGEKIGFYFEIYNAALDSASGNPALQAVLRIRGREDQVVEERRLEGWALNYANERAYGSTILRLDSMAPGPYLAEVSVQDSISGQNKTLSSRFRLVSSKADGE